MSDPYGAAWDTAEIITADKLNGIQSDTTGVLTTDSDGVVTVTFPSAYASAPVVVVARDAGGTDTERTAHVVDVTTTGFSARCFWGGAVQASTTGPVIHWVAVGQLAATSTGGVIGSAGIGDVPSGGTTGQALVKSSNSDYATEWATVSGVGGGAAVSMSNTVPASPSANELWVHEDTATLYIYDGSYFVELGGIAPDFDPTAYDLDQFGGFVDVGQGGFGFSIDSVDGDPAGALALLGGAPSGHAHNTTWVEITSTTYTLSPSDVGKTLLFNITGNAACTVTLPNQATESGWLEGRWIGLLAYSSGTITIAPAASVNVDGVTATSFDLVQHARSSITRMPADNFWNFSGQVA